MPRDGWIYRSDDDMDAEAALEPDQKASVLLGEAGG